MKKVVKDSLDFIKMTYSAVLKFYDLDISEMDLKKDLIINMLTTVILQRTTYSTIMKCIVLGNSESLKKIQKNMQKFRYKVNLEKLGVRKYF